MLLDSMMILALPQVPGGGAGIPEVSPTQPPFADKFLDLGSAGMWMVYLACAAGIAFAGGKMAWERYNAGSIESPKKLTGAIIGCIVVASAVSVVNWASS